MKYLIFTVAYFLIQNHFAVAQEVIPLYLDFIPNSKPVNYGEVTEIDNENYPQVSKITKPTLSIYLPRKDRATGTAVIICPGGGYWNSDVIREGSEIAGKLNESGIAAFVLKYRMPSDQSMQNKEIGPLQDAQRAIQLVRERSGEWHINPHNVGIMGFSAGGHLAATAGTHFQKALIENSKNISLRPDFMILIYPVISFTDSIGHIGSRNQLLGRTPNPETIFEYSNEFHVTSLTPPAFIMHASDDDVVKVQNSIYFFMALQRNGIYSELHIYPHGGHGFGLVNKTTTDDWMERLKEWIKSYGRGDLHYPDFSGLNCFSF